MNGLLQRNASGLSTVAHCSMLCPTAPIMHCAPVGPLPLLGVYGATSLVASAIGSRLCRGLVQRTGRPSVLVRAGSDNERCRGRMHVDCTWGCACNSSK